MKPLIYLIRFMFDYFQRMCNSHPIHSGNGCTFCHLLTNCQINRCYDAFTSDKLKVLFQSMGSWYCLPLPYKELLMLSHWHRDRAPVWVQTLWWSLLLLEMGDDSSAATAGSVRFHSSGFHAAVMMQNCIAAARNSFDVNQIVHKHPHFRFSLICDASACCAVASTNMSWVKHSRVWASLGTSPVQVAYHSLHIIVLISNGKVCGWEICYYHFITHEK